MCKQRVKTSREKYPAHKLMFLPLKWSISEKIHDNLYGNQFEVVTDNNPLSIYCLKLNAMLHVMAFCQRNQTRVCHNISKMES